MICINLWMKFERNLEKVWMSSGGNFNFERNMAGINFAWKWLCVKLWMKLEREFCKSMNEVWWGFERNWICMKSAGLSFE